MNVIFGQLFISKVVKSLYEHTTSSRELHSRSPRVFMLLSEQINELRAGNPDTIIVEMWLLSIFIFCKAAVPDRLMLVSLL